MRKLITCAAAAVMVTGSSVAQAAPVAIDRTGSDVAGAEALGGTEIWMGLLAAGLLIFVLFQINGNDEDDLPASP